ncbi:MAG: glycosyltransferase family 9 protein [Candidatus Caenarcaniphilales bacterium]|nr:glycosyltransferase family 9 protein [Candidatus Caenarcaniphilales bacterium]
MRESNKTTEIILPNRIGDSVLSLPALLCLKQLQNKYNKNREITIYPPFHFFEVIWSFKLFETKLLEEISKVHSWFSPADETFFLSTSYKSLGIRTQKSYGENIQAKPLLKYNVDLPYLSITKTEEYLSPNLVEYLRTNFGFSIATIRIFGILKEMGYSEKQIIETFQFDNNSLELQVDELNTWSPTLAKNNYLVCCMEAAYGRKREAKRRWDESNYIELAEKLHRETSLLTVFVGTDTSYKIPQTLKSQQSLIDLRGKLTLVQLTQLIRHSKAYYGNDTGPLHIANLMKRPSIGIYLSTDPKDYGPIFKDLNKAIIKPQSLEKVSEELISSIQLQKV